MTVQERRVTLVDARIVDRILDRLLGSPMPPSHVDGIDSPNRETGRRMPLSMPSTTPRTGVTLLALRCAKR